jgi:glutamate racemase
MRQLEPEQPIGIFDSGVGGLTVAHSIKSLLPNEKIIYFGDTFHLPYGDKSSESVQYYARRISDFLLEKNCKTVLIACNTASANAFDEVVEHVAGRAIVLNVVDPVVSLVSKKHLNGKVGVIGTKGTINSKTYEQKIHQLNPSLEVISMATPLFVPMIEEGFIFDDISNAIIRAYLSDKRFDDIHSMILGCTHYPIIKRQIEKFFDFGTDIIDAADIVARELKSTLEELELINTGKPGGHEFYISDFTPYFEKIAKMFFESAVHFEHQNFWK